MGGILLCGCLVLNWVLLKRGTGSGEREAGTGKGEQGAGNGKGERETGSGKRPHQNFALCFCEKMMPQ